MSINPRSISSKLLLWSCLSALIAIAAVVAFVQFSMIPQMTNKALESQTNAMAHALKGMFPAASQWTDEALAKEDLLDSTTNGGKMVATLFVLKDGQYVRAATTLKKEDGTRAIGTALDPASAAAKALGSGQEYTGPIALFKRPHMASYLPIQFDNGVKGAVFVGIDYGSADDMLSLAHRMVYVAIVVGILAVVLLAVSLAFAIRRILTQRLGAFITMAEGLAAGRGDLTLRLDASSGDELARVATAFNVFLAMLHDMFVRFKDEAEQMGDSARRLGTVVHQTNQQAHAQQDVTGKVASAAEQISTSIAEVAGQAARSKASTDSVKQSITEGSADLTSLATSLTTTEGAIAEVSQMTRSFIEDVGEINQLVGLVSEIADQTNLLALNAAIEAARAGESGRGFAVVADEVRKLATRSNETANAIGKTTQNLAERSERVSGAMNRSEASLRDCVDRMSKVKSELGEIDKQINEVAAGADDVATMVSEQSLAAQDIARSMASLATTVESTVSQMDIAATIATELEGVSQTMSTALSGFSTEQAQR